MKKKINQAKEVKKVSADSIDKDWERRIKNVCKPCWELKYCPYGILVEKFPIDPPLRDEAIAHDEFLKSQLNKRAYTGNKKKMFEEQVKKFNPNNYPVKYTQEQIDRSCTVYGHHCPVFYVNEPFTETEELRRIGRYIPRDVMMRVVRRDNNQCQLCGRLLKDNEIEFDHIIPVSKGGSSEENNIRVTCFDCNRDKSNRISV